MDLRPREALKVREASLEAAHNPRSPIRSTGSLPLHLTASDAHTLPRSARSYLMLYSCPIADTYSQEYTIHHKIAVKLSKM